MLVQLPAGQRHRVHLHEDDLPLRWEVWRAGSRTIDRVDDTWIHRAVPRTGVRWSVALAWGRLRLASPPARLLRRLRRAGARLLLVTFYKLTARD